MPLQKELEIHDLHLKYLKLVDEQLAGLYRSAFKGHGYELAEIRKYVPGDEIRLIDWNVTARTGKLHIRQNMEDKELSIYILADASASGLIRSYEKSKQRIIAELSVIISLLCIRNRDRTSVIKFTDHIEGFLPASKSSNQGVKIVDLLFNKESQSKGTNLKSALNHLIQLDKKNALVFLISDFLDTGYRNELEIVSELHDLICLQVTDPLDMKIPDVGLIEFEDVETGKTGIVNTSNKKLLKQINDQLNDRQEKLHALLLDVNCEHVMMDANEEIIPALKHFFNQRKKGRGHVGA